MPRSKTPSSRTRTRKADVPKAKPQLALPSFGENAHTAIAVAVVAVAYYFASGNFSFDGFNEELARGVDVSVPTQVTKFPFYGALFGKSFNLVLLLHVLNSIATSKTQGYWMNKFAQDFTGAFAGMILPKILEGNSIIDSIFIDPSKDFSMFSFFFTWYIVNYDIPFCPAKFGLWDQLVSFGGPPFEILLDFGTAMFTTNLIVSAVAEETFLATSWFQAVAFGVAVGTASSFFPFNKGMKFTATPAHTHAFAVSCFLASGGFKIVDCLLNIPLGFVGADANFGDMLNNSVCDPFGGVSSFVVAVTALNYFFGHVVSGAFPTIDMKPGFDVFGLFDVVLSKAQLA